MKRFIFALLIIISSSFLFSQEALKSIEENYYDFLSLKGTVKRPTLGYRTLSDSEWIYTEQFISDEDEEDFEEISIPEKSKKIIDPWKNNLLGVKKSINGSKRLAFKLYGLEWYNSINSETPFGQNDGALWQGKGYNLKLTTGFRFQASILELTLKPEFSFSQNKEFDTIGDVDNYSWCNKRSFINKEIYGTDYDILNYAGGNIDLVQRFGDGHVKTFDWGDSEIRLTFKNFTLGFGTQKPWIGPAMLNPMLGSNNSGSYPKFDIGLRRTQLRIPGLKWYLGDIEGRLWTGTLYESDYFDDDSDNDKRMIHGLSVSYAPSFIPGLSIGANRIYMTSWKTSNFKFLGKLFLINNDNGTDSGNDEDQKVSLYADWIFQKIGFEIYGEYGFDDFSQNKKTEPFHTGIYTVGVKQYIPLPINKLFPKLKKDLDLHSQLIIEINNFEMSQDYQLQFPYLGYYSHGAVSQGYTNRGQILGAGSGYFGNSQFIEYKVYYPKGSTSFHFHRYCPNNNIILSQAVYTAAEQGSKFQAAYYQNYESYYDFGISTNIFVTKALNISAGFDWVEIYNWRYYQGREKRNLQLSFGAKYNFF